MGTRMTVYDEKKDVIFYGSKLFGYANFHELESLRYLWELVLNDYTHELYSDFEDFGNSFYYCPYSAVFGPISREDFDKFIALYNKDLKKHGRKYQIDIEMPPHVRHTYLEWG